jgi:hypothetical protein
MTASTAVVPSNDRKFRSAIAAEIPLSFNSALWVSVNIGPISRAGMLFSVIMMEDFVVSTYVDQFSNPRESSPWGFQLGHFWQCRQIQFDHFSVFWVIAIAVADEIQVAN